MVINETLLYGGGGGGGRGGADRTVPAMIIWLLGQHKHFRIIILTNKHAYGHLRTRGKCRKHEPQAIFSSVTFLRLERNGGNFLTIW